MKTRLIIGFISLITGVCIAMYASYNDIPDYNILYGGIGLSIIGIIIAITGIISTSNSSSGSGIRTPSGTTSGTPSGSTSGTPSGTTSGTPSGTTSGTQSGSTSGTNGGGTSSSFAIPSTYKRFRNTIQSGSDYCMDVWDGSDGDGTGIHAWGCHSGTNQKFYYDSNKKQIITLHSKCLDVDGGIDKTNSNNNNGKWVLQYECHSGDNQKWQAVPEKQAIKVADTNKCLQFEDNPKQESRLIIKECDGSEKQKWTFD